MTWRCEEAGRGEHLYRGPVARDGGGGETIAIHSVSPFVQATWVVFGCIRAMLPAETAVVLVPTLQISDSPVTGAIAGCQGADIVSLGDHR
jgi:hypothetical protein